MYFISNIFEKYYKNVLLKITTNPFINNFSFL